MFILLNSFIGIQFILNDFINFCDNLPLNCKSLFKIYYIKLRYKKHLRSHVLAKFHKSICFFCMRFLI